MYLSLQREIWEILFICLFTYLYFADRAYLEWKSASAIWCKYMPQRVSFFNLAFLFPFGEIPTVLPMRLRFCRFIIISLSIFYVFLLCSIICSCMLSTSFSFNFFFSCPCLLVKIIIPHLWDMQVCWKHSSSGYKCPASRGFFKYRSPWRMQAH